MSGPARAREVVGAGAPARSRLGSVLAVGLGLGLAACATAADVEARGTALERRLDPERTSHCPAEPLARGLAEVAFARGAARRGDPVAAKGHLDQAEAFAEAAEAAPCLPPAKPPEPTRPLPTPDAPPAPPDLDGDGLPDALDPDDDGDGASDAIDQCPREPEDLDGTEDIDGCPEAAGPNAPPGAPSAPPAGAP